MEFLGPQQRVLGGVLISCFYAVGGILMGVVGYFFQNWRHFLLVLYTPALLGFTYLWIVPESVRWLLTHSRTKDISEIIKKAAKMNNKELSDNTLLAFEEANKKDTEKSKDLAQKDTDEKLHPYLTVFKSKKLLLRVANCSFCWLTNTFVYYGLSLNAVTLAGNKYYNFVFSNLIEIPAHLLALILVNKLGRRWSMCGSLVLAGLSCIAFEFVSPGKDFV